MSIIYLLFVIILFYAHVALSSIDAVEKQNPDKLVKMIVDDVKRGYIANALARFDEYLDISKDARADYFSKHCHDIIKYAFEHDACSTKSSSRNPMVITFLEETVNYMNDDCVIRVGEYVFNRVKELDQSPCETKDEIIVGHYQALAKVYLAVYKDRRKHTIFKDDEELKSEYTSMLVTLVKSRQAWESRGFYLMIFEEYSYHHPSWGIETFMKMLEAAKKVTDVTMMFRSKSSCFQSFSSTMNVIEQIQNEVLTDEKFSKTDLQRIMTALVRGGFDYNKLPADFLLKMNVPYPNLSVGLFNEWCRESVDLTPNILIAQVREYQMFGWPKVEDFKDLEIKSIFRSECLNYAVAKYIKTNSSEWKSAAEEMIDFELYLKGKLSDKQKHAIIKFPLERGTTIHDIELYDKLVDMGYHNINYEPLPTPKYPELKELELEALRFINEGNIEGARMVRQKMNAYHPRITYEPNQGIFKSAFEKLMELCVKGDLINYQKDAFEQDRKDLDAKCLEYLVDKGHDQDVDQLLSFLYDQHEKSKYHPEYAIMKKLLIKAYKKGDKKMVKVLRKHGNRRLAWVLMWLRMKKMFGL